MGFKVIAFAATLSISGVVTAQQREAVPVPPDLFPYSQCYFPDGLRVAQLDPFIPGITARTVETADGNKQIDILEGERVMFAYYHPMAPPVHGTEPTYYANVKVEKLPGETYPELRKTLLENYEFILASDPTNKRSALKSLNGLDVYGLDRAKLEGGVLGVYLLLDNKEHITTTIYLLNEDPHRRFHTIVEYGVLRDRFLKTYTTCIHDKRPFKR